VSIHFLAMLCLFVAGVSANQSVAFECAPTKNQQANTQTNQQSSGESTMRSSRDNGHAKPLNIVLLYADDWRYDSLGIAGNRVLQSPNIDQLARDGVRFERNCVTTSICGVSRASLLTGQWMSRHGNRAFDAFKTPWSETFPGVLRDHGYWVGHVGKWHCGPFPKQRFDFGRSYAGKHWIKQPDGTAIHVTKKNENDALEFLRSRPADKPFCLTLAFFATHAEDANPKQYLPQPASMALYRDATIAVPATASDEYFRRLPPLVGNERNEGRNRWHWRFDAPDKYQEMMKNYYRLATEVDAVCGSVVAELKKQGVLDETLVIFTTDNGYFHGEHGLADKWYPYEESIRVPLVIRDPRIVKQQRGKSNDALMLNVDLAPTILAAAGAKPPRGMQGRDIAPLYLEPKPSQWRDDFFYEHPTIKNKDFIPASQALVTREWKYVLWPEFDYEELFDLRNDATEQHDLARAPEQRTRIEQMRRRFAELRTAAGRAN
jgi:arylsulfatase A-like enzyme